MKHKKDGIPIVQSIFISALIICFFVGIIIIYYTMLYSETRENIIKNGEINALDSAKQIDAYLSTGVDVIKLVSSTLDNMLRDGRSNEEMLDYLVNQSTAVINIMPECANGIYAYINEEYLDGIGWVPDEDYIPVERPWYIQAKANEGDIVAVDPYLDSLTNAITISLAKTLCDGKSVVAMDISMQQLQTITENTAKQGNSDIEMILDQTDQVIAHSDPGEVGKSYAKQKDALGNIIAEKLHSFDDSCFSMDYHGTEYIVYAMPVKNNWTCVSVINATSAYNRLKMPLVLTIVATVLVITILLVILINSNRKSILAWRLSVQTERALAASAAKSAFLSNMSHEIRTPINAVLGMNEMILRESKDSAVLTYAQNVRTAGTTLLGLVNDILDFSKIEAGKMEIIPVEYSLASLLNDLVNMIQTKADAKGLQLVLDFDHELPELLLGDEIRIKQVITNILTNAVKYTEEGSVTFCMDYRKDEEDTDSILLQVAVRDTGIGIKQEDIEKLFSEFDRIEEERNRNIEGTGLGMSITKRLLDLMDSALEVDSVYGEGSEFRFAVRQKVVRWDPIGDYETAYQAALGSRETYREKFIAPTATVLVVDDTPMNLVVFESLLKSTKVHIETAESGDEGLFMSVEKKYDIIFLDHMMPGKNGIETLHEMRESEQNPNSNTPIVCLTANAISGAREQYLAEGFDDYLTKPIDSSKLEDMLLAFLPEEKIQSADDASSWPEKDNADHALEDDRLEILRSCTQIDVNQGIQNSGSAAAYMPLLKIFYDSIEDTAAVIETCYQNDDMESYTIKVHALKSSARIIGAIDFGEEAQGLEDAGKRADIDYIAQHHEEFMDGCRRLKQILQAVFDDGGDADKPMADEDLLQRIYETIRKAAEDMDCDTLEGAIDEIEQYSLPEEETGRFAEIKKKADAFDYEGIQALLEM